MTYGVPPFPLTNTTHTIRLSTHNNSYTSVSTSIFRLFDCSEVQGEWYLTADFTVRCFEGEWNTFMGLAVLGILVFTLGIPLGLFVLLRRNRATCTPTSAPRPSWPTTPGSNAGSGPSTRPTSPTRTTLT